MTYNELTELYLADPAFLKLSDNSKKMYESYLRKLVELGGYLPVRDADMQNDVARSRSSVAPNLSGIWFLLIDKCKQATNSTKLGLRTALSITYKWAVLNGYITSSENFVPYIPKDRWKTQRAPMHPFTVHDMAKFYAAAMRGQLSEQLKPYALFTVAAFDLGCRPDEMYRHQKDWFTKRDGDTYLNVVSGKGKARGEVTRLIHMQERVKNIIQWFKGTEPAMSFDNYTFLTDKGRPFCQELVSTRVKEVCRLLGVEERKFYETRHGLATAMYEAEHSDQDVADRLGSTIEVVRSHYINKDMLIKAKRSAPTKLILR
jgi:integrase